MAKNDLFRAYDPKKVLNELATFSVYSRDRGGFVRTATRSGSLRNQKIGELVGTPSSKGYLGVRLFWFTFKISHLVWLAEHGDWCSEGLDHFDGMVSNNHITNLRPASAALNNRNTCRRCNNSTGITGVNFDRRWGRYRAAVRVDSKEYWCGYHDTPEEAFDARQNLISAHPEWGFTKRHDQ